MAQKRMSELLDEIARLRSALQAIQKFAATDPDDRDYWPGGSDEMASAVWTLCVAVLTQPAPGGPRAL